MTPRHLAPLICCLSALLAASCTPGTALPEEGQEPAGQEGSSGEAPPSGDTGGPGGNGSAATGSHGIDVNRLRLPEMETLPDERELNAGRPDPGGGGVIARPPSE